MIDHQDAFNQIAVTLSRHFECLYYVDYETGHYTRYVSNKLFNSLGIPEEGEDFFQACRDSAEKCTHPDDLERMLALCTKESLQAQLAESDSHSEIFRVIVHGTLVHVRQIMLLCGDRKHVLCCMENIEDDYRRREEQEENLESARRMARLDEMTGIRNNNAYLEYADTMAAQLAAGEGDQKFAVLMCDVNDLKRINDIQGHNFGDEAIRQASHMICDVFRHSPVFRVGGDEFVVIVRDRDYEQRDSLYRHLVDESVANGRDLAGPVVACGMAVYDPASDHGLEAVVERADREMYAHKKELKIMRVKEGLHHIRRTQLPVPPDRKRKLDSLFGALYTVAGGGYVYINDMRYDYSRWSLSLIYDFDMESEYLYNADIVWEAHVHPDDVPKYREAMDATLSSAADIRPVQYRARRKDGTYGMYTFRGSVLCDDNGDPEYFTGIIVSV
ncbi:MAG: diguanylate cyclase [Butyrivibrio sp.]|nr:diguanylate cyclase [Butyrivibrio sp.]